MANYQGVTRTNYFRVTDVELFNAIMQNTCSEDSVDVWHKEIGEETYYAFGAYDAISYLVEIDGKENYDYDELYAALQKVVHPNDAIMITEIGSEKLRYLVANTVVITKDNIKIIELQNQSEEVASVLLGNPDYKTEFVY